MVIVKGPLKSKIGEGRELVGVRVDRRGLGKRRWRGVAEDGKEFGFDLEEPLRDGDVIWEEGGRVYCLQVMRERLLEVELPRDVGEAAVLGWRIGNLHFPVEVVDGVLRVEEDDAVRQLFEREGVKYKVVEAVFCPRVVGAGHGHTH